MAPAGEARPGRWAPIPGALLDFGLFFAHNAKELVARGSGPYLYLPKMESHLEAQLWNDVFELAQKHVGLPTGTIRATVLIETLPAAFEMHEILHALRDHSAGLNCGRWDYIFSFIKKRAQDPSALLPDRAQITMDKGFLRAYTELLIQTCHAHGAHAMGGMAAQIPIKDDPAANAAAMEKVRNDKLREVKNGHDGTWVAHPALVPVAREISTPTCRARISSPDCAKTSGLVAPTCCPSLPVRAPMPGFATTSGWECSTSRPGSGVRGVSRSTI